VIISRLRYDISWSRTSLFCGEKNVGFDDHRMPPSPSEHLTKWCMLCGAQRMPTEPEGSESASDSGESKDKKVCTSQESQESGSESASDSGESKDKKVSGTSQESQESQRRQRVRLNTSLQSPIPAIPGCLDGNDNVVDGEDLDASSNRNLAPPGPAAENFTSHSRARSDRSNMRFEADCVRESIRREYNRKLGKIGPWL